MAGSLNLDISQLLSTTPCCSGPLPVKWLVQLGKVTEGITTRVSSEREPSASKASKFGVLAFRNPSTQIPSRDIRTTRLAFALPTPSVIAAAETGRDAEPKANAPASPCLKNVLLEFFMIILLYDFPLKQV